MRANRSSIPFHIFAVILIAALTLVLFGSAPNVRAQDEPPTPTPTPEVQIQIIGGDPADPGEWPWQVALISAGANPPWLGQFCGGSLIHPQWVLTAAHCVTEENGSISNPNTIDVIAGIYDLWYGVGFQRKNGNQIIRHPSYVDNNTFNHDLALIKLDSPVTIDDNGTATATAVIPLAQSSFGSLAGWTGTVTGWGNTATGDPPNWPDQLQEVELPIMSNATCGDYNHWGYGITANMLCAGYDAGGYSSCQGDSGGPLVVSHTGTYHLAGIVSFGPEGCAVPQLPSVFTRVSRYVTWINNQVDLVNPAVSSITRADPNPTVATSVNFTVAFSETVTGVDAGDFILTTSGVSGASITSVTGSGSTRTVTVNTGSNDGTIRLDLIDDDSIVDVGGSNVLGGTGAGNGDFTSGQSYTIDRTPPTVLSIARLNASPNAGPYVTFLVTFSEAVLGADYTDFSLVTAGVSGASIHSVNGTNATRTVRVNTGVGDGTIGLNLADDDSITDLAFNALGGVGAGNGDFTGADLYTIDKPQLPAPLLRSPRNDLITGNTTHTFWWRVVTGGETYEIQFATDSAFTADLSGAAGLTGTSHTPPPFADDQYFWHVRAYTAGGQPGSWSATRTFTIDTTGPAAPVLTSPIDSASTSVTPTFRWTTVPTAVSYQFQYDNDSDFSSPTYTITVTSNFRRPPAMAAGTYSWHVRARDTLGNWSLWSTPRTVDITGP